MASIVLIAALTFLICFLLHVYLRQIHPFLSKLRCVPELKPCNLLIGNIIIIVKALSSKTEVRFSNILMQLIFAYTKMYEKGKLFTLWLGWQPIVVLFKPQTIEPLLTNKSQIDKAQNYEYLHPWLGTGLLTATGNKWKSRRKLLTPAFHFRILDDFIPIINEQSKVLVDKLSESPYVDDLVPIITACSLDIICETAMGTTMNAQNDPKSDYVKAVHFLGESFMLQQFYPQMWWKPIFQLTPHGRKYYRALDILHGFTRKVIQERKKVLISLKNKPKQENGITKAVVANGMNGHSKTMNGYKKEVNNNLANGRESISDSNDIGSKKCQAFLDLLLEHQMKCPGSLTDEDIREEVDTFTFAGHDTLSLAISWALYLIGLDAEVQAKIHEELDTLFDTSDRAVTAEDLYKLKYLECCIKETLRIFPPVPLIGRRIENDTDIGGYVLPRGTQFGILIFMLHRDSENFPNPERFDPDRFLPENVAGRHPYAYLPFSAGVRNCIGQRFALMEQKIILAQIFRHFEVQSLDPRENVTAIIELVTRPCAPLRLRFHKRMTRL